MRNPRTYSLAGIPLLALVVAFVTSGCGGKTVTVPGDMVGCVYSNAQSGSQFERSIQPGQSIDVGKSDELVLLPTGDQIYTMTRSSNRTAQAPSRVLAFTKGQTAVWVEGVLKFRFNTAGDKACKWYSKYGLQTGSFGDLGFAVTTKSGVSQKPPRWVRFPCETHRLVPLPCRSARRHDEAGRARRVERLHVAAARVRLRPCCADGRHGRAG